MELVMEVKEVPYGTLAVYIDSWRRNPKDVPLGRYICQNDDSWLALDNSDGNVRLTECRSRDEAIRWVIQNHGRSGNKPRATGAEELQEFIRYWYEDVWPLYEEDGKINESVSDALSNEVERNGQMETWGMALRDAFRRGI